MTQCNAVSAEDAAKIIQAAVLEFTDGTVDSDKIYGPDWNELYTASPEYLNYLGICHQTPTMNQFLDFIIEKSEPGARVWDVGCACGYSGLTMAMNGFDVAFYDFEGLGLDFVRHFAKTYNGGDLNVTVLPYSEGAHVRDLVLAIDVIEHTYNQLGFLKWVRALGQTVAFTYPITDYHLPFQNKLEQWVDHEAITWVLERRYEVLFNQIADSRAYVIFK